MQKVVQEFNEQRASCNKLVEGAGGVSVEEATSLSAEEKYLARMRPLQFGEYFELPQLKIRVEKKVKGERLPHIVREV